MLCFYNCAFVLRTTIISQVKNPATEPSGLWQPWAQRSETTRQSLFHHPQIPFLPGTTAQPPTLWFCIHKHNLQFQTQLLLLLLNTNHLRTVHAKCDQAHDNRDHIWPSRNRWTLTCMRFWQFCKITVELHVHANSKWFSMMQSDVQKDEYSVQWTN